MATETKEKLSRERILDAAIRIMDDEGLEAVSMRRLGRELGVEAMSLYNHVHDKQAVLDGILEAVMEEFHIPEGRAGSWEDRVRTLARSFRMCLRAHPNVMQIMAKHRKPMSNPSSLRPIEESLATLREAGLSPQDVAQAYKSFGGYVMGFVVQEVGGMFGGAPEGSAGFDAQAVAAGLPEDELPNMKALLPLICGGDADNDFEYGLSLLLGGLRAKLQPS